MIRTRFWMLVLVALCLPTIILAEPWDDFLKFTDRFYFLDHQNFETVTAKVRVPIMIETFKNLTAQLAPLAKTLRITGSPEDFTLTYTRGKGLQLHPPALTFEQISLEGVKDPEKAKKGLENIRLGFQQQVDGVQQMLEGVFEGYELPKKGAMTVEQVTQTGDVTFIRYKKPEGESIATYTGLIAETHMRGQGVEVRSREEYMLTESGKMVVKKAHGTVENLMMTMDNDLEVGYEKLDGLTFPNRITSTFQQKISGVVQKGEVEIFLEDLRKK